MKRLLTAAIRCTLRGELPEERQKMTDTDDDTISADTRAALLALAREAVAIASFVDTIGKFVAILDDDENAAAAAAAAARDATSALALARTVLAAVLADLVALVEDRAARRAVL